MIGSLDIRVERGNLVAVAKWDRHQVTATADLRSIRNALTRQACHCAPPPKLAAAAGADPSIFVGAWWQKVARPIAHATSKVARDHVLQELHRQSGGRLPVAALSRALETAMHSMPAVKAGALRAFHAANHLLDGLEHGSPESRAAIAAVKRAAHMPGPAGDAARKAAKVLRIAHNWRRGLRAAQRQVTSQTVRGLELGDTRIEVGDILGAPRANAPIYL